MRPEVYLDESYINRNHSNAFVWYSSDEGPWIQNPSGQGERLIIMDAITDQAGSKARGWCLQARTTPAITMAKWTGDVSPMV